MIAKISTGRDPKGLAAYLHGPGRQTPHSFRNERGRLIAGGTVLCGTVPVSAKNPTRWGRDFVRAAKTNARVRTSVWHCSLRCAPGDRTLTDAEFSAIAQTVAERMGFAEHPWVAVRHDDDHIHLAVSRVNFLGRVWKNGQDRWRIVEVMREVEQQHDLVPVPAPHRATARAVSTGERRRAERTGQLAPREVLREVVAAARDIAAGRGQAAFEDAVAGNTVGAEVRCRRNVASTGRMHGYSFHLDGHLDADGEPIWWPASKLSRELAWAKLSTVLDGPEPDRRASQTVVPRKLLERTHRHDARRQEVGQEQFAAERRQQTEQTLSALTHELAGPSGGERKWQQVQVAMSEQQRSDENARRAAEALQAVTAAAAVPLTQMLRAQQEKKKPWTPEMKRQYAIAKARAERDATAAERAKWTELPGGGLRRDIPGTTLRMWVSDDGAWSLTRRADPDHALRSGHAAHQQQACAQACAAARHRLETAWQQLPADKRTPQRKAAAQRAVNSLHPVAPATVPPPTRTPTGAASAARPATPPPSRDASRDRGLGM